MATYGLRRFARAKLLRTMTPLCLLEFLAGWGLQLPSSCDADGFDYEALAGSFMEPGPKLLEALFLVKEMASQVSTEALVLGAQRPGISPDGSRDAARPTSRCGPGCGTAGSFRSHPRGADLIGASGGGQGPGVRLVRAECPAWHPSARHARRADRCSPRCGRQR